jgi:hypothetical protein
MTAPRESARALCAQRIALPGAWRETVYTAVSMHGITHGAVVLGVTRRTIQKWLAQDADLRERVGVVPVGRPRKM